MDAETKEKLTELQHQIEMLRTDMEANMKTMRAENEAAHAKNESAVDRLVASNEKAIGGLRTTIFVQMVSLVTLAVAIIGVFIAYLQFFK